MSPDEGVYPSGVYPGAEEELEPCASLTAGLPRPVSEACKKGSSPREERLIALGWVVDGARLRRGFWEMVEEAWENVLPWYK